MHIGGTTFIYAPAANTAEERAPPGMPHPCKTTSAQKAVAQQLPWHTWVNEGKRASSSIPCPQHKIVLKLNGSVRWTLTCLALVCAWM